MTDRKEPQVIADDDLEQAQGGATIELTNATIASVRQEQQIIEYQDGNDPLSLRKRPGRA